MHKVINELNEKFGLHSYVIAEIKKNKNKRYYLIKRPGQDYQKFSLLISNFIIPSKSYKINAGRSLKRGTYLINKKTTLQNKQSFF